MTISRARDRATNIENSHSLPTIIGGCTIHSFAGVGSGTGSLADLARRVMGNEYTKQRWREVDILVIDEISMMAGSFLDKLNFIASRARNDRRPFGGVREY